MRINGNQINYDSFIPEINTTQNLYEILGASRFNLQKLEVYKQQIHCSNTIKIQEIPIFHQGILGRFH